MLADNGATEVYERAAVDAYLSQVQRYVLTLESEVAAMRAKTGVVGQPVDFLGGRTYVPGEQLLQVQARAEQTASQLVAEAQAVFTLVQTEADELINWARSAAASIIDDAQGEAARLASAADAAVPLPPRWSAPGEPPPLSSSRDPGPPPPTPSPSPPAPTPPLAPAPSPPPADVAPPVSRWPQPVPQPPSAAPVPWWAEAIVTWPPSLPAPVPWARSAKTISGPWIEVPFHESDTKPALTSPSAGARPDEAGEGSQPGLDDELDWAPPSGPMYAPPDPEEPPPAAASPWARVRKAFRR